MPKIKKREMLLLFILGGIYPIYPAILLYEIKHTDISIFRISIFGFINAFLLPFFVVKGLKIKINFDIDRYLDSTYSKEEQKEIIKNYSRYKSKFFQNTPLFTRKALYKDVNLIKYRNEAFKAISKLLVGGLCYFAILFFLFYFFIWM